jgi:hypothetical protein
VGTSPGSPGAVCADGAPGGSPDAGFSSSTICKNWALTILRSSSASKFSGLAQAASPVTVNPLRSTRTQKNAMDVW